MCQEGAERFFLHYSTVGFSEIPPRQLPTIYLLKYVVYLHAWLWVGESRDLVWLRMNAAEGRSLLILLWYMAAI